MITLPLMNSGAMLGVIILIIHLDYGEKLSVRTMANCFLNYSVSISHT